MIVQAIHTTNAAMKFLSTGALLVLGAVQALAATQWGFTDGSITVSEKGAGVGSGTKAQYVHLGSLLALHVYAAASICAIESNLNLQVLRREAVIEANRPGTY